MTWSRTPHAEAGLIDAFDGAIIQRNDKGKVSVVKKHQTPDIRSRA
jgi:hypothetical protein